jgi:hypothetical protein
MTGEKKMKTTRTLTLSCLAVATLFGTSLVETSMADPLDKSSPKIAHGMYRDRGKSSPKIAHGMYRDRGKSSPKIGMPPEPEIAHGMYRDRGKSSPKIAHGMYRDRGKSSPKIVHGMYRDRGKSSPKIGIPPEPEIAHGMYRDRGKSSPKIAEGTVDIMEENIAGRTRRAPVTINMVDMVDLYFDLLAIGESELADEVGMEVEDLVRELGYFRGRR